MNYSRKILAGALVALLPMGSALACTTNAWLGTPGANAVVADDPNTDAGNPPELAAVARISGSCGAQANANGNSFVTDNTPGGAGGVENIYRARWYGRFGQAGAQVFSATTADNGGGTPVITVTFTGSALQFDVAGTTVPNATNINGTGWYSVEIFYQANGPFSATVATGGTNLSTQTVNSVGNAGANGVGSVRLGHINAGNGTGNITFDEFDSSRSAGTAIGRLCPGDSNNSWVTSNQTTGRTVADAALIRNEALTAGLQLAVGQPDTNENGSVTAADASLVRNLVLLGQGACP